jgi:hypothetical protein
MMKALIGACAFSGARRVARKAMPAKRQIISVAILAMPAPPPFRWPAEAGTALGIRLLPANAAHDCGTLHTKRRIRQVSALLDPDLPFRIGQEP